MSGWGYLQAHAASACRAGGAFCDEFDAREFERRHNLDQAVHDTAHIAAAGLHTLDRRHGKSRQLGQSLLVDAEQGAGGAYLSACDHGSYPEWDKKALGHARRYVKLQSRCFKLSFLGDDPSPSRIHPCRAICPALGTARDWQRPTRRCRTRPVATMPTRDI